MNITFVDVSLRIWYTFVPFPAKRLYLNSLNILLWRILERFLNEKRLKHRANIKSRFEFKKSNSLFKLETSLGFF